MAARGVLRTAAGERLFFWCPGCEGAHHIPVGNGDGPRWDFNGDHDRPTFRPSILVEGSMRSGPVRCHSFVTDGRIQFLDDCNHALAGKTVDLLPFDKGVDFDA